MGTKNQLEWARMVKGSTYEVTGNCVLVRLSHGRGHRVMVSETDAHYVLQSLVAKASSLEALGEDPVYWAWRQNCGARLYHLYVDERRRLMGNAIVPKPCFTSDEFMLYLITLARACDTMEYMLTGGDREQLD